MLLLESLTLFLNEYENKATRETYADALKPLAEWLGNREMVEISGIDLVRYTQRLKESSRAPSTIQKHIKTFKTFFLWAERLGLTATPNPVAAVKQKRVSQRVRKDKAMSDDELITLLDYAKWKPRDYAIILFLSTTGCRAGGVANLKIEDLQLEDCMATVTEKFSKSRRVMFDDLTADAIRRWLPKRGILHHSYVFTWNQERLTSAAISQIVRRCCLKAGIRSLGSHSLRHRIGHKFAAEKVAPPIAQSYLGHEDVLTTMRSYYPDDWTSAEAALRTIIQTPESNPKIVKIQRAK